jgi:hypothetical protein
MNCAILKYEEESPGTTFLQKASELFAQQGKTAESPKILVLIANLR